MGSVRVLVGTHKGAFVLTSNGRREHGKVGGPHFAGWEIYHRKGSPADPSRPLRGRPDPAVIRVVLPAHLRSLAHIEGEVALEVEGLATQRSVLDALEARYPMLRGTIRDQGTQRRRPFVRFFACEEDLSHEPPDAPLPGAIVRGAEPFMIVGAMAGG